MKLKILLSVLTVVLTAVAYQLLQPAFREATLPAEPPPAIAALDDSPRQAPEPVPVDETPPAAEPGDGPETEVVLGLKVRKDRNCTVELRYVDIGEGNVVEAYACTPNEVPEPGYYDVFDNATLQKMAYSDAGAAEALGKRIYEHDPEAARTMMIRSVALRPENIKPVLWLADQNYSLVAVNGEPAFKQMQEKYLLTRIAEELGDPGASAAAYHALVDAGASEVMMEHLERQVLYDLRDIRDIQIEVTGESDLPEVSL